MIMHTCMCMLASVNMHARTQVYTRVCVHARVCCAHPWSMRWLVKITWAPRGGHDGLVLRMRDANMSIWTGRSIWWLTTIPIIEIAGVISFSSIDPTITVCTSACAVDVADLRKPRAWWSAVTSSTNGWYWFPATAFLIACECMFSLLVEMLFLILSVDVYVCSHYWLKCPSWFSWKMGVHAFQFLCSHYWLKRIPSSLDGCVSMLL